MTGENAGKATPSAGQNLIVLSDIELPFNRFTNRDEARREYSTLIVMSKSQKLGGGSGKVFKAMTANGRVVALKMPTEDAVRGVSRDSGESRELIEDKLYREEFATLSRVNMLGANERGHFPAVYALGYAGKTPAIIMEWVEGVCLDAARLELSEGRPGHMSSAIVAQLGISIFSLLRDARESVSTFVHRDISPANVMIRTHERTLNQQMESGAYDVCLVDFGSASIDMQQAVSFTQEVRVLRGATADYAAPEMLTSDLPDLAELRSSASIDVYEVCSVLYDMLCGHPPYKLSKAGWMVSPYSYKRDNPIEPTGFAHNSLAAQLADILVKGIVLDQGERPTANELCDALNAYLSLYQNNARRARRGIALMPIQDANIALAPVFAKITPGISGAVSQLERGGGAASVAATAGAAGAAGASAAAGGEGAAAVVGVSDAIGDAASDASEAADADAAASDDDSDAESDGDRAAGYSVGV